MFDLMLRDIETSLKVKERLGPIVVYTGIGTAASPSLETGQLEMANYHQFPPFLQEMKRNIPLMQLYILLIDPRQEDPPYLITDPRLNNINKNGLFVYSWREDVGTVLNKQPLNDEYEPPFIDITANLQTLNAFAIKNCVTTFYHDFTGKPNHLLAEFFDEDATLNGHYDHIIYGLNARQDLGCYFDLTAAGCYYAYRMVDKDVGKKMLTVFNYYHDTDDQMNQYLTSELDEERINVQRELIISQVKALFRNRAFSKMRHVYAKAVQSDDDGNDGLQRDNDEPCNEHFTDDIALPTLRQKIVDQLRQKKYFALFENLVHYYAKPLDRVAKILQLDLTGYEILEFILQSEPYQWYDELQKFLQ